MKSRASKKGPLTGVKVLDLSRVLAGPLCCQHLADLGASVLKVEMPGPGDETRAWGPPYAGAVSAYFLSCNRGKTGIRLDLKSSKGRALLTKLCKSADVLVENFRPTSLKGLGIEYSQLKRLNSKLIVCSISGYGRNSPFSDQAGYDFIAQGLSGMMAVTGPEKGPPSKVGVAIADVLTSLYGATAICAALSARKRGCHIDLSLMDCILASQVNLLQSFLVTKKAPRRYGNAHHQIVPYQMFSAKDGPVILAIGNDRQFGDLCEVLNLNLLPADLKYSTNPQRVKNRTSLIRILTNAIKKEKRASLIARCTKRNIPAGPILSYEEFATHPHLRWWLTDAKRTSPALIPSPFIFNGKRLQAAFDASLGVL